jgi:RNA polymerase sigma-32 factor
MKALSESARKLEPLYIYWNEVQKHKLLDRAEEKQLARQYRKTQDEQASRRLIRANLRLVIKIAREYYNGSGSITLGDLIQQGNLGLVNAVKRYDPDKKTKFSYYASFWIKAYIFKYLLDTWSSVKIGTTQAQRKLFFNLKKMREQLKKEGVRPTPERIAKRLGVRAKEVVEMEHRMQSMDMSLNEPSRARLSEEMVDTLASDKSSAEEFLAGQELKLLLKDTAIKFKGSLNSRESEIFERRIFSKKPLTLQTLGEQFGISRERVRQIESNIIEKLRAYMRQEMPDFEHYLAS